MIVHIITDNDTNNKMVYFCLDASAARISGEKIHQLARDLCHAVSHGQAFVHYTTPNMDTRSIKRFLKTEGLECEFQPGKLWVHPELEAFKYDILAVIQGRVNRFTVGA